MSEETKKSLEDIHPEKRWRNAVYEAKPGTAIDDALRAILNEVLKVERERIYSELKELNSDDNPFFRGVRNGQIYTAIFGEEK